MFNAPWPALVMAAVPVAGFLAHMLLAGRAKALSLVLSRAALEQGQWIVLLNSLFVQPYLFQAVIAAVMMLALGAPVARYVGARPAGMAALLALYIGCGLIAEGVFLLVHGDAVATSGLGASGALSGMIGAASRLLGRPQDQGPNLAPILSTQVIGFAVAWLVVNLLVGVAGLAAGGAPAAVGVEAQLAGFAAGVLLIGLLGRLLRRT